MNQWHAAVVGCGRIGSAFSAHPHHGVISHAEAFVNHAATRLVAVCDANAAAAQQAAALWGLDTSWVDLELMLESTRPAIVSICVPDASHFAVGCQVIRSPSTRLVIMEKPLALSLAEAASLVSLASSRRVGLAVNFSRRHAPGISRLKSLLAADAIGAIQCVSGHYTNGLLHNGSHWLDLLTYLLGEVTAVSATNPLAQTGIDPTLSLGLELASGGVVSLHACREACFSCFDMDVVGSKGRVGIVDFGNLINLYQVVPDPQYAGFHALRCTDSWPGGLDQALPALIANAIGFLDGSAGLCSPGHDALKNLELGLAAAHSYHVGKTVRLPC